MKRKVKRKKLKIKNVLFVSFLIIFIIVIINYISKIPVKGYYIKGNTYYTDNEILKMTNLDKYPSFLLTNSITVTNKVKKDNLIKNIKIKKSIFFEFTVIVNERKILFYDEINKKLILEEGYELDKENTEVPSLVNKIENKKIYNKFLNKMYKVDDNILNIISEIKYDPNYIDNERFLVSMNDGNYVYLTLSKFQSINNYAKISKTLGEKNGILYLDYGNYFLSQ